MHEIISTMCRFNYEANHFSKKHINNSFDVTMIECQLQMRFHNYLLLSLRRIYVFPPAVFLLSSQIMIWFHCWERRKNNFYYLFENNFDCNSPPQCISAHPLVHMFVFILLILAGKSIDNSLTQNYQPLEYENPASLPKFISRGQSYRAVIGDTILLPCVTQDLGELMFICAMWKNWKHVLHCLNINGG